jgi:transcriptional regulator with XRE-family HTH domain
VDDPTTAPPGSWADWLADRMRAVGFEANSDLARATGVPDSVISRWRTSGTTPSIGQLRRLQTALQVSLVELLVAAGHLTPEEAGVTAFTPAQRLSRSTRDAIRHDPELGDELKHLLEVQYDAMVALARARAASTGRPDGVPGVMSGSA